MIGMAMKLMFVKDNTALQIALARGLWRRGRRLVVAGSYGRPAGGGCALHGLGAGVTGVAVRAQARR